MRLVRDFLKNCIPPIVLRAMWSMSGKHIQFEGDYVSWEMASKKCSGYDAEHIVNKVLDATLKVKEGEAVFERDSVLFDEIQYAWQVVAGLMWVAARNRGNLKVLDFGGALGSSYFQYRKFLQGLSEVQWNVVEQMHYVLVGQEHIQDNCLRFYPTIDACFAENQPNVVLFSGVLQYLPEPYIFLEQLIIRQPDYIIIDRTPFIDEGDTVLTLQKVPKEIVDSNYPVWLFNESEFKHLFSKNYSEIATFDAIDGTIGHGRLKANFKGVMYKSVKEKQDNI